MTRAPGVVVARAVGGGGGPVDGVALVVAARASQRTRLKGDQRPSSDTLGVVRRVLAPAPLPAEQARQPRRAHHVAIDGRG